MLRGRDFVSSIKTDPEPLMWARFICRVKSLSKSFLFVTLFFNWFFFLRWTIPFPVPISVGFFFPWHSHWCGTIRAPLFHSSAKGFLQPGFIYTQRLLKRNSLAFLLILDKLCCKVSISSVGEKNHLVLFCTRFSLLPYILVYIVLF